MTLPGWGQKVLVHVLAIIPVPHDMKVIIHLWPDALIDQTPFIQVTVSRP